MTRDIINNYFLNSNYTYETISIEKIKNELSRIVGSNIDVQVTYNKDIKVFEGVNNKPIINEVNSIDHITIVYSDYSTGTLSVKSLKIKLDA